MPFLFRTRSCGQLPMEYGRLIKKWKKHHLHVHPPTHPSFTANMNHLGPMNYYHHSWLITIMCINPQNGHAGLNPSPYITVSLLGHSFISLSWHCSFIVLILYCSFTLSFSQWLNVMKVGLVWFCVSPWSNHLPSLLKGPSHVI